MAPRMRGIIEMVTQVTHIPKPSPPGQNPLPKIERLTEITPRILCLELVWCVDSKGLL